jgi:DNA-binding transcriptional MocR family regulator
VVTAAVRPPGFLDAHVGRLIATYRQRRDAMIAALERHFPSGCTWTRPDGGLFLWVTVPPSLDTQSLLPAALAAGVAYVPGAPFWVDRPVHNTLRLNFSRHARSHRYRHPPGSTPRRVSAGVTSIADRSDPTIRRIRRNFRPR